MNYSISNIIGKLIQLTGIAVIIWGLATKNPAGAIGTLIALLGRAIDEYWEDWFG